MTALSSLPNPIIDALRALNSWLSSQDTPYTLIGGIAVSLVAEPRVTKDIDVLVMLEPDRWSGFLDSCAPYGFAPRMSDALDFARLHRVLLLKHTTGGVDVDISFGALPFETEAIEGALERDIGRLKMRVASPADLVIMKAVAMRPKDQMDIVRIVELYPDLDVDRICHWVGQFAEVLEMPEMIASLEALLHKRAK